VDEGKEAVCGFVVAGCDAAGILEFIEEALNAVAQSIKNRIDWALHFAVRLGWNDGIGSVEPGLFADGIAVVASIGEQRLRADIVSLHQRVVGRRVVRFAGRDDEAKRKAFAVRAGVNFARKAAARAAKTLVLSPPFAPAA